MLYLAVVGLSIGGDCFAMTRDTVAEDSAQGVYTNFSEVRTNEAEANVKQPAVETNRAEPNVKQSSKKKAMRIALRTAMIGTGVLSYCFVPGVSEFVNSNAKAALVKGGKAAKAALDYIVPRVFEFVKSSAKEASIKGMKVAERGIMAAKAALDYVVPRVSEFVKSSLKEASIEGIEVEVMAAKAASVPRASEFVKSSLKETSIKGIEVIADAVARGLMISQLVFLFIILL